MNPLALHKLSRILYQAKVPLLPKLLKALNYLLFNCVLPPECEIGEGCTLFHSGLGIIIHPSVKIGRNTNIYNFVVIGGGHDTPDGPPIFIEIGDNCNISAGAKILCRGERLTVGDNATIAANAVVVSDVPANAIVGGIPAKLLKLKS